MRAAIVLGLLLAGCARYAEAPPGATEVVPVRYTCDDSTTFTARFDNQADVVVLYLDEDFRVSLAGQRPASGIWYAGGGWSLRGKGTEATLTRPDGRTAACRGG